MKKKYAMTLLEIMIVIFIIGIIGSVIGYNMRGSLDNGKAFKTKEGSRKLYEIVQLETAQTGMLKDEGKLSEEISTMLKKSGLVKNVKELMRDGWGNDYQFRIEGEDLRFRSEKYDAYCQKKGLKEEYPWDDDEKPSHS
ncbi:MAG: prepilin-type N-terminal cleavage/methylation domain-containing protein [Chlamydiales bacterium]|nr:prepilin-type N-terminal cleavage/methylation domain-containing protein [Chlamydiia bacterium]MCP5504071.1 prepilin-type N-terminal cleavage/methylation domain-containing protein [Chlamydiales bacterium]